MTSDDAAARTEAMPAEAVPSGGVRPQSLMLSFFGGHVLGRAVAVYSGSVIDVFGRVGVSEEAVRSTLTRMVGRDLLQRHRRGRKVYFGLTPHATGVLQDGRRRVWSTGVVDRDWDGTWTVVGFTLPDTLRTERHLLRSRLVWAGFGPLQNGLWIASGRRSVDGPAELLADRGHLTVLAGQAMAPTGAADLVRRAFDLSALGLRYRRFLRDWDVDAPRPDAADDLCRQLLLETDWLGLVRHDPHLPLALLPEGWPAVRAEDVFRRLSASYDAPARALAAEAMDVVEIP